LILSIGGAVKVGAITPPYGSFAPESVKSVWRAKGFRFARRPVGIGRDCGANVVPECGKTPRVLRKRLCEHKSAARRFPRFAEWFCAAVFAFARAKLCRTELCGWEVSGELSKSA
jgi:hypothetical protein